MSSAVQEINLTKKVISNLMMEKNIIFVQHRVNTHSIVQWVKKTEVKRFAKNPFKFTTKEFSAIFKTYKSKHNLSLVH